MRREELCDPSLSRDWPEDGGGRCDHYPLDKIDAAQTSERGLVIRCALELMAALKLGVHVCLEEIVADGFQAMLIIAEEQDLLERTKMGG